MDGVKFPDWTPEGLKSVYQFQLYEEPNNKLVLDALYRLGSFPYMEKVWEKILANSKAKPKTLAQLIGMSIVASYSEQKLAVQRENTAAYHAKLQRVQDKARALINELNLLNMADQNYAVYSLTHTLLQKNWDYRAELGENQLPQYYLGSVGDDSLRNARIDWSERSDVNPANKPWGKRTKTQKSSWWAKEATSLDIRDVLKRLELDFDLKKALTSSNSKSLQVNLIDRLEKIFRWEFKEQFQAEMRAIVSAVMNKDKVMSRDSIRPTLRKKKMDSNMPK